jgi:hypothetical protein
MKKIISLGVLIAGIFASCTESEYEYHQTYFTPQEPNGKILYADQVVDSTRLVSYDPWKASTIFNTDEQPWFTITPTECDFIAGEQFASTRIDINTSVNNTGKVRVGHISINTYDIKSYQLIGLNVTQYPWHNITYPMGYIVDNQMIFNLDLDTPNEGFFNIEFTVYSDNSTLTSEGDWLKPELQDLTSGKHVVKINVKENTDTENSRTTTLKLTSGGVTTPITVTQAKANF